MKAISILSTLLFSIMTPMNAISAMIYSDLPENHIYAPAINHFSETELVSGYDNGSFGTDKEINRVEALKIIMQYWDLEFPEELPDLNFTDTETDTWYEEPVKQGISLGIVSGYPDRSFKPSQDVNRAEALKMILIAGNLVNENPDAEIWFSPFLDYAKENILLTSGPDGDYMPNATLTRGEFLDILYRFDYNDYTGQDEYGGASYYADYFHGRSTASGEAFDIDAMTAAHRTLPFGTLLRVTNLNNNQAIDVRVNDRGPFIAGRIIDLSPAAYESIAHLGSGVTQVRIEILTNQE